MKQPVVSALLLAILITVPATAEAQRLVPDVRHFRTPVADPLGARMSAGIKQTNLLESSGPDRPPFMGTSPVGLETDVVAVVSLGGILPLVSLSESDNGGVTLYADARVFSRFRIELPGRDDMGQDWFVGGGVEMRRSAWSGKAAIMHRSSHLGDEFMEATGARRIEFGGEQLDLMAAHDVSGFARVYAGGSWIFNSYLDWEPQLAVLDLQDRIVLQAGADNIWQPRQGSPFAVYAGVDVQAAERTAWDVGVAAAAGIGVQGRRSMRLMMRYYDGPSTMGEFFLTPERSFAIDLVIEI